MPLLALDTPWDQKKPPYGSTINKAHPLSQGLVACYLINEAGGQVAYDATGDNNTGISQLNPIWGTGKYGLDLKFNGLNQWINIGAGPNLSSTNKFTLSAWVFPNSTPQGSRVISTA